MGPGNQCMALADIASWASVSAAHAISMASAKSQAVPTAELSGPITAASPAAPAPTRINTSVPGWPGALKGNDSTDSVAQCWPSSVPYSGVTSWLRFRPSASMLARWAMLVLVMI